MFQLINTPLKWLLSPFLLLKYDKHNFERYFLKNSHEHTKCSITIIQIAVECANKLWTGNFSADINILKTRFYGLQVAIRKWYIRSVCVGAFQHTSQSENWKIEYDHTHDTYDKYFIFMCNTSTYRLNATPSYIGRYTSF